MKVLLTGGEGFIGSNFVKYLLENKSNLGIEKVLNLDKKTYAGKGNNLKHMSLDTNSGYEFIKGDICDKNLVEKIFSEYKPDKVFNFAAESHVDRSIINTSVFRKTNFEGTGVLLDAAIRHNIPKFIQISTDEVYGSLKSENASSIEIDPKHPRSFYSATKSGAEDLVIAAFETYGLPTIITRSSNNYGPYQFPEKLLPKFITNLILGKKVPLMWTEENQGSNIRDWLHVEDNCRAIWLVSGEGNAGEVYNIGGDNERTNYHMTKQLLKYMGLGEEMIEKVAHRKGHDFRYSVNTQKLKELGFKFQHTVIEDEIPKLCKWYEKNEYWWRSLLK